MVNEEIAGTDVNKDWTLNNEGDLSIVQGSDNLSQAVYLRLTAYLNSMDWAYYDYGSRTKDWLGKNQNVYTRDTLVDEIRKRVLHDPRIYEAEVEIINWTSNSIGIKLIAHLMDGETYQDYMIFSDLPRKNDNVNSPEYSNTWIDTKEHYYAKQGEWITVNCFVRDKLQRKVPIGEVSVSIGGYRIPIANNPQEIAQSGTPEPGLCTFRFLLPHFVKLGTHKLIFKYKGIRGYNNCVGETNFHVVERLPTSIKYIYRRNDVPYYYANDWDLFTDPKVHVKDINNDDVLHGEVKYYLSDYDETEKYIFLEFPIIFHNTVLIQRMVRMKVNAKLLDYSHRFIFRVNYMFRPLDIFELVAQDGTHIDFLECRYEDKIFFLTSTDLSKPPQTNADGEKIKGDSNNDIDTLRNPNEFLKMEVVE